MGLLAITLGYDRPPYSPLKAQARYRSAVRKFGVPLKARLQLAWMYYHLVASSTRVATCEAIGTRVLLPHFQTQVLQTMNP